MTSKKEKNALASGQTPDRDDERHEIVPYEAPPIPVRVVTNVVEYFRQLGAEIRLDEEQCVHGISALFFDHKNQLKAQVIISGGRNGHSIKFQFPFSLPKFIDNDKAIRLLKKGFNKITLMGKLGYLDIERRYKDHYTDHVQMGKEVDTADGGLVMDELERMMKVLGLQKPQRRTKKSR